MPSKPLPPITMDAVYAAPGYLFRRMQQIAVSIFMEECKAFDLTPVQYAALIAIHTHPGIDATRLSAVIAFDRSTLGSVIERLQAKDYIERKPAPEDKVTEWAAWANREGLGACEALIADEPGPFCFGPTPGMADLSLVPQLGNARRFGVDVSAYPRLLKAEAAAKEMKAFADAAPDKQPDAE